MDRPAAGGFVSLTGPSAPRVVDCPSGNAYKVSVTGSPFCVIWHDRHSADWLAALASPFPAAPDFSTGKRVTRFSGRFAPLRIVFPCHPCSGGRINRSMLSCRDMAPWLSTHSAPSSRGKGGGWRHQRGIAFPRPPGRLYGFSCCRKATFILAPIRALTTTLAPKGETTHYDLCVALLLQIMFAVHAKGASNLSPLRTFGPAGRQPSSPIGACPYGACHIASAST